MDRYVYFWGGMLRTKQVAQYDDKIEILESLVICIRTVWEPFIERTMPNRLNIDYSKRQEALYLRLLEHMTMDVGKTIFIELDNFISRNFDDTYVKQNLETKEN